MGKEIKGKFASLLASEFTTSSHTLYTKLTLGKQEHNTDIAECSDVYSSSVSGLHLHLRDLFCSEVA